MPDTAKSVLWLPYLKRLQVCGICELCSLIDASPNLNYLCVDYDCLIHLLDDKHICDLFEQQIIRLDICDWTGIESDPLKQIAQVFRRLNHLVLVLKDSTMLIDSIPLTLLTFWNSEELPSLSVDGSPSDEAKKNLRQWLIDNTRALAEDSFGVEYKDGWFSLWL
ncbi:unnamed protein product [Rotaria sp. Silwood2]|nr:unnamed protein product [Rotaria sp. Silwood2]CAF2972794.1 unnamed protein product [Rotaria sp. Silwood2]CAF3244568.1 unnamed protein product [Rotaria sp. Silwood2]CAF3341518.1 unnamed protein product [Rotaria sp. Silwood2]CAF4042179.1 unnamed protein product [Rotaria sp. Silwood2]